VKQPRDQCVESKMRFPARSTLALALLVPLVASAGAETWDLAALRVFASLTADQWKAVNRGEVQARVLDTPEKREVAVVGVAYLRATTACFVTKFQDIETFKKNPAVLRIRKFTPPVGQQDLEGFSLETRDLADLANCRIGNCNVKLSAGMIERLNRDVDWSRSGHDARAQAVVREELLSYFEAYLDEGNSGLIEYLDKKNSVRLAREFRGVLDARPGLEEFVPEFREYLAQYPGRPLPGVGEFFYWSTESFGLKPVASITHVYVYVQPGQAAIASKQIYASHYFDVSLGLTAALDDPGDASNPGMYLVYLNRSRIDLLGGFFGGLRRAILPQPAARWNAKESGRRRPQAGVFMRGLSQRESNCALTCQKHAGVPHCLDDS
jgi:hypothetical protein